MVFASSFHLGKLELACGARVGRAKSDLSVNSHRENFIFVFIAHRPFRGGARWIGYTCRQQYSP
jgi:hypothetical protein